VEVVDEFGQELAFGVAVDLEFCDDTETAVLADCADQHFPTATNNLTARQYKRIRIGTIIPRIILDHLIIRPNRKILINLKILGILQQYAINRHNIL
jgi:hypothetical protein